MATLTRTMTSTSTSTSIIIDLYRHSRRADDDDDPVIRASAEARPFDVSLSPAGHEKAQLKHISGTGYIFCSPFWRCIQTAKEFQDRKGGIIMIDNGLCEVWHPKVTKVPLAQVALHGDEVVSTLTTLFKRNTTPLPTEEETRGTGGTADARYRATITRIAKWCAAKGIDRVTIVSHGDSVSSLAAMCGVEIYSIEPCGRISASYDGEWTFLDSDEVGVFNN